MRRGITIARIEERMLLDRLGARGWYIECRPDGPEAEIFRRVGFSEIALAYRQPAGARDSTGTSPLLRLLYKPFGRVYGPPRLGRSAFLDAVRAILPGVYGMAAPDTDPGYQAVRRQAAGWPDDSVPWRIA